MKPARPAATPFASRPAVENLEDRSLFSSSIGVSFHGGSIIGGGGSGIFISFGSGSGDFGFIQSNPLGLPSPTLGLPNQSFGLSSRILTLGNGSFNLNGFGSTIVDNPGIDLRGSLRGSANLTGFGSSRLNFAITRQRAGTITGSFSLPRLGISLSGKVPVTFLGNRTFSFGFSRGSNQLEILARLNKNGTMTGEIAGQLDTRRLDGTFSLNPIRS